MSSDDALRAILAQLLKGAVSDPKVLASKSALQARLADVRRCFGEAMSDVLESHNAQCPPLHNDVFLLILEHLPFDDLLAASRTCRRWRALALANSRLWSHLTLHAYDGDEDKTRGYDSTIHNIPMLHKLLPRARTHLLQLDVEITAEEPTAGFASDLVGFLATVAPRIVTLNVVAEAPWFVAQTLEDHCRVFPELRDLSISSRWESRTYSLVSFEKNVMPKLEHLALGSNWRLSTRTCWPGLRVLECASDGLVGIESVLSDCTLQRLQLEWTYDRFEDVTSTLPDAIVLFALHAIPDVQITAELAPVFVQLLFDIFAPSPAPRLHLYFTKPFHYIGPLQLRPCTRLTSAVKLSIAHGEKSVIILAEDGSGHRTQISLREVRRATVYWALIPSLDALTSLSIEASLWPELMQNFPKCSRLAELTIKVGHAVMLESFLAPGGFVPRAETVTLRGYSELNTTVSAKQVNALETAVRVSRVLLEGVTVTDGKLLPGD